MSSRKRARGRESSTEREISSETESTESESESDSTLIEKSDSDSSYTAKCSTRLERRKKRRQNYLAGKARQAHTISAEVKASFEEDEAGPSQRTSSESLPRNDDVCMYCAPVLQKYAETFKGMKMQGTELKKRKKINPHPKKPNFCHYRDLKKQNEWLRNNVFDAMGNYLFCCKCIHTALGVAYKRLAHQRSVKRAQYSEPLRTLTKGNVIEQRLSEYVVMPPECDLSFSK